MGNDTVHLAANEETPHLSWSNDAKVNYPNVPEAQMHRLIAYVIWSLLETWYSYVASFISDSAFFFVFVHICFSRNRLPLKGIFLMVYIGRFLFFVLAGLQAYPLALYLQNTNTCKNSFYRLVALYCPAIVLRLYIMFEDKKWQWLLLFGHAISLVS